MLRKKHDESNEKLGTAAKKLKELASAASNGKQAVAAAASPQVNKHDVDMASSQQQAPAGNLMREEEIRAWYRDIQESHEKHLEHKLQ